MICGSSTLGASSVKGLTVRWTFGFLIALRHASRAASVLSPRALPCQLSSSSISGNPLPEEGRGEGRGGVCVLNAPHKVRVSCTQPLTLYSAAAPFQCVYLTARLATAKASLHTYIEPLGLRWYKGHVGPVPPPLPSPLALGTLPTFEGLADEGSGLALVVAGIMEGLVDCLNIMAVHNDCMGTRGGRGRTGGEGRRSAQIKMASFSPHNIKYVCTRNAPKEPVKQGQETAPEPRANLGGHFSASWQQGSAHPKEVNLSLYVSTSCPREVASDCPRRLMSAMMQRLSSW